LPADIAGNEFEDMAKSLTNRLEQFDSLGHDLTPDAIACQHRNGRFHLLVLS
jgi:hypothetical protein